MMDFANIQIFKKITNFAPTAMSIYKFNAVFSENIDGKCTLNYIQLKDSWLTIETTEFEDPYAS